MICEMWICYDGYIEIHDFIDELSHID